MSVGKITRIRHINPDGNAVDLTDKVIEVNFSGGPLPQEFMPRLTQFGYDLSMEGAKRPSSVMKKLRHLHDPLTNEGYKQEWDLLNNIAKPYLDEPTYLGIAAAFMMEIAAQQVLTARSFGNRQYESASLEWLNGKLRDAELPEMPREDFNFLLRMLSDGGFVYRRSPQPDGTSLIQIVPYYEWT